MFTAIKALKDAVMADFDKENATKHATTLTPAQLAYIGGGWGQVEPD